MAINYMPQHCEHDGCDGCKYEHRDYDELPCIRCKQNFKDCWTAKENGKEWIDREKLVQLLLQRLWTRLKRLKGVTFLMTKPTVFNYKYHEELRQAYKELLADNQQLIADNRKLRQEVTELKQLNDGYVKIIAKNKETNNKLMASVQKQTGSDYISRADAIEAVAQQWLLEASAESPYVNDDDIGEYRKLAEELFEDVPSADAVHKPDYSYEADMVRRLKAVPSADAVPQSEQYKKGFEDAKRAFELEYARESENLRKRNAQLEVMRNAQKAISADAVHGEWKFVDHEIFAGEYFCNICGKRANVDLYGEWILSNYCPSCGARMTPYKGGDTE